MKTRNPNKAPMSKHPARALRAISAALEYGDLVHGDRTWVDLDPRLLLDAAMRHLTSAMDPSQSDVDPDSGLHHLAHLGANVELLLELLGVDYQAPQVPERFRLPVVQPHPTQPQEDTDDDGLHRDCRKAGDCWDWTKGTGQGCNGTCKRRVRDGA